MWLILKQNIPEFQVSLSGLRGARFGKNKEGETKQDRYMERYEVE